MAIWDDMTFEEEELSSNSGTWKQSAATQAKCPTCASALRFDANLSKLFCKNCGNLYKPESLESVGNMGARDMGAADDDDSRTEYFCDNCGAVVVTDEHTAATFCAFCGSPALMKRRLSYEFKPDYIIPFKLTKEDAKKKFFEWVKKNKYAPRNFIDDEGLSKITGVYVPFWLIDADCVTTCYGSGRLGQSMFYIDREIAFKTRLVPFDASKSISNLLMEAIEPFDYKEIVPYDDNYLPGFFAKRYDETALEMTDRIQSRIDSYARQMGKYVTVHEYDNVNISSADSYSDHFSQHYALFPVWFLKYQYKGLKYTFAVNGQTGEAVGDIPYSPWKRGLRIGLEVALWVLVILAILTAFVGLLILPLIGFDSMPGNLYKVGGEISYNILCAGSVVAGPLLGFILYRIRKVSFETTNPLDSAPEIENYVDLSGKISMVKHDKFTGIAPKDEKENSAPVAEWLKKHF
ncbi:MAG: hypothetical protein IJ869_07730 [Clostridiales bacterium]|nr:hypothetical protein [Clostridiales bacterium]